MYIFTGAELRLPFIHHMYETEMLSSTVGFRCRQCWGEEGEMETPGGLQLHPIGVINHSPEWFQQRLALIK